jgi:hypothetical protein
MRRGEIGSQPVGQLAQRNPSFTDDKEAGYAGACHRAAPCADRWADPPYGPVLCQAGAAISRSHHAMPCLVARHLY